MFLESHAVATIILEPQCIDGLLDYGMAIPVLNAPARIAFL
jgi:hypothetical protein